MKPKHIISVLLFFFSSGKPLDGWTRSWYGNMAWFSTCMSFTTVIHGGHIFIMTYIVMYIIMVVADGLAPNRCQAIFNRHMTHWQHGHMKQITQQTLQLINKLQGWFQVCAQPMKNGVTKSWHLSLAGHKPISSDTVFEVSLEVITPSLVIVGFMFSVHHDIQYQPLSCHGMIHWACGKETIATGARASTGNNISDARYLLHGPNPCWISMA